MKYDAQSPMCEEKQVNIELLIRDLKDVPGAIAEVGVYRGVNALRMAKAGFPKAFYGFDTFMGIPEKGEHDVHEVGDFSDTDFTDVVQMFHRYREYTRAHIIMGKFPRSTVEVLEEWFSVVHLDGDQYQVTKDGLEYFWQRLSPGGVIVMDDFHWPNCPGVSKALFEFLEKMELSRFELRVNQMNQAFLKAL